MAQLVSIKEAARMLGIESRAVKREGNRLWELLKARKLDLPYIRIGRRYMFDPDVLLAWRKNRQQVAS